MGEDKPEPPREGKAKPVRPNAPHLKNLDVKRRKLTERIDATLIPGFTDRTVLQLIAEVGLDVEQGLAAYEQAYRDNQPKHLKTQVAHLGFMKSLSKKLPSLSYIHDA